MTTTAIDPPLRFAGVPAGSWAFGIRIWLAVVVALAASFWLELEVPSTAAVTVAILAEPTAQPILGHVTSVTRGIGVSDAAAGTQGLPNVDPVYTWVRLAQRVPVRIAIDSVPPGIPLVSGMTATVRIKDAASAEGRTWLDRAVSAIETRLSDVLNGRSVRPGCIPATTSGRAPMESLPVPMEKAAPLPEQINPGLAPGMNAAPRNGS